jgi:hypothetical protein
MMATRSNVENLLPSGNLAAANEAAMAAPGHITWDMMVQLPVNIAYAYSSISLRKKVS